MSFACDNKAGSKALAIGSLTRFQNQVLKFIMDS